MESVFLIILAVLMLGSIIGMIIYKEKQDKKDFNDRKDIMLKLVEALAQSHGIDVKKDNQ